MTKQGFISSTGFTTTTARNGETIGTRSKRSTANEKTPTTSRKERRSQPGTESRSYFNTIELIRELPHHEWIKANNTHLHCIVSTSYSRSSPRPAAARRARRAPYEPPGREVSGRRPLSSMLNKNNQECFLLELRNNNHLLARIHNLCPNEPQLRPLIF